MLRPMAAPTSTTQQVYRQRSPLAVATVSGVTGFFLLLSLARNWARYPQPLLAAWVLLGLAWVWALFVRPAVVLNGRGVTLRNILRDVHIPWAKLTHVETGWNLRVFAGDRGYTSWAISTQIQRPSVVPTGMFGRRTPGPAERRVSAASAVRARPDQSMQAAKVTAVSVARSIEKAKGEYDVANVPGGPAGATDLGLRVTWVTSVIVVLLVPVVAVVVLTLV